MAAQGVEAVVGEDGAAAVVDEEEGQGRAGEVARPAPVLHLHQLEAFVALGGRLRLRGLGALASYDGGCLGFRHGVMVGLRKRRDMALAFEVVGLEGMRTDERCSQDKLPGWV